MTLIKVDMFKQSVKKEMSAEHLRYINSFPKEWREDPTIVNLVSLNVYIVVPLSLIIRMLPFTDDVLVDVFAL